MVPMNVNNIIIINKFLQLLPYRYVNPVCYRGIVFYADYIYTSEKLLTSKISWIYRQNGIFMTSFYYFLTDTLDYKRHTANMGIETS